MTTIAIYSNKGGVGKDCGRRQPGLPGPQSGALTLSLRPRRAGVVDLLFPRYGIKRKARGLTKKSKATGRQHQEHRLRLARPAAGRFSPPQPRRGLCREEEP